MIILNTTDIIRFKLGAPATSIQPSFMISYVDITNFAPSNTTGAASDTNYVTLVGSPTAGVRQTKQMFIYNGDTVATTIQIEYYNTSTTTARKLVILTLQIGETFHYNDSEGIKVTDVNGYIKVTTNAVSLYTALSTNAYITFTYNATTGTITAVPINDTTIQKTNIFQNGLLKATRSTLDLTDTDDERFEVYDDNTNNKVIIRNYDNRNIINLIRSILFELVNQGFNFDNEDLLRELTQYDGFGNMNSQRRK